MILTVAGSGGHIVRVCSPSGCALPLTHAYGGCPFTGRAATIEQMHTELRRHRAQRLAVSGPGGEDLAVIAARPGDGPGTWESYLNASEPGRDDQAVRELAHELARAKDMGFATLILDDADFDGALEELLPAAVRAAWTSGQLGTPGGRPLWWDVPEGQPGRTVLTDLAAGLGRPVPRGTNPSVCVTDRLLRGLPLLVVAGIHRLGATRTPRTSPVPALYDITCHAAGTLLVVTGTATKTTLAAMPDSGSFLSHATLYRPGGPPHDA